MNLSNWFRGYGPMQPRKQPLAIRCGGQSLPFERSRQHYYLLVGAIGSGKTTLLEEAMQSIVPCVRPNRCWRAIVFDPQDRFLHEWDAMRHPHVPLFAMNPFLAEGTVWDMAADVREQGDVEGLAATLIPETEARGRDKEFFDSMSRLITTLAVKSLIRRVPGSWDLLDLIITVMVMAQRKSALDDLPEGRIVLENMGSESVEKNINASLLSHFGQFMPMAAVMRRHLAEGRGLSLRHWIKHPSLMVLCAERNSGTSLEVLNRMLIQLIRRVLLDRELNPQTPANRTVWFLDELGTLGPVDGMETILSEGRNYGSSVIAAFQTVTNLNKAFGKDNWKSIVNLFGNVFGLRQSCHETATWLSDLFGQVVVPPGTQITKRNGEETQRMETVGGPLEYEPLVHASDFLNLPDAGIDGVRGFLRTPLVPGCAGRIHVPLDEVAQLNTVRKTERFQRRCPSDWLQVDTDLFLPHAKEIASQDQSSEPPEVTAAELCRYLQQLCV